MTSSIDGSASLLADVLPAQVIDVDGHVLPGRGRAFIYPDLVWLYFQDQSEPTILPITGPIESVRDTTYFVPTASGSLKVTRMGCGGCSPLRRLVPPR